MSRRRPVLVVFAREPVPGTTKTRLIKKLGAEGAALLAAAFNEDAMRKAHRVAKSQLVIAGSAPQGAERSNYFKSLGKRFDAAIVDQGSGGLGERMRRVLERFASAGVFVIGTDTPSLPRAMLGAGVRLVERASVVLSPSLDGGYCGIGVRGSVPDIFIGMKWGGSSLLADTLKIPRRLRADYALGPSWYDVDRWSDVVLLAEHLRVRRAGASVTCPSTLRLFRQMGLL